MHLLPTGWNWVSRYTYKMMCSIAKYGHFWAIFPNVLPGMYKVRNGPLWKCDSEAENVWSMLCSSMDVLFYSTVPVPWAERCPLAGQGPASGHGSSGPPSSSRGSRAGCVPGGPGNPAKHRKEKPAPLCFGKGVENWLLPPAVWTCCWFRFRDSWPWTPFSSKLHQAASVFFPLPAFFFFKLWHNSSDNNDD